LLNQPVDSHFNLDEELFRRYLKAHFHDGELDPSAIRFDEPPSVVRGKYSEAKDALSQGCAGNKDVSGFGVLVAKNSEVSQEHTSSSGDHYVFEVVHSPLAACYAHSEIRCFRKIDDAKVHVEPPKDVRRRFRVNLARALSVAIAAP